MASDNLSFTSYNVKGIQQSSKRIKVFEYLQNNSLQNTFVLLQETHSSVDDEKQQNDNFQGKIFYSHGATNSCGVTIGFLGSKSLEIVETKNDDQGRILILDIKIWDKEFLLVNLYNAKTEKEQLDTLIKLSEMLNIISNIVSKNVILGGDFNLFNTLKPEICSYPN